MMKLRGFTYHPPTLPFVVESRYGQNVLLVRHPSIQPEIDHDTYYAILNQNGQWECTIYTEGTDGSAQVFVVTSNPLEAAAALLIESGATISQEVARLMGFEGADQQCNACENYGARPVSMIQIDGDEVNLTIRRLCGYHEEFYIAALNTYINRVNQLLNTHDRQGESS
jgi:hypothetical protein